VRYPRHVLLTWPHPLLIVGCVVFTGGWATLSNQSRPAIAASSHVQSGCANNTTNLQDPATADAYSANSWVAQHTVVQDAPVTIYTGAYDQRKDAVAVADPTQRPVVTGVVVLGSDFKNTTRSVPAWSLSATNRGNTSPVAPDCTQGGRSSTLYQYTGSWKAPRLDPLGPSSATFYLAVTFTFSDGTQVQFFTNMKVVASPSNVATMHTLWYDTSRITGLPPQNTDNSAYNIFASGTSGHLQSQYYFAANPAGTSAGGLESTSSLDSVFLSAYLDARQQPIFQNSTTGQQAAVGARIRLPYLAPGQTSASGSFPYFSYSSRTGALDVPQTGVISVSQGAPPGAPAWARYVVTVDEPFSVVRPGGTKADVQVGSYILDNSFSGPVADGQGSQGDNLGEGRVFHFYSNPGMPLPAQPDSAHLHFSWTEPDRSTWGLPTAVSYILTVIDATAARAGALVEHTYQVGVTTQDVPSSAGDPLRIVPGHEYAAAVQAVFTFGDGSKISSSSIDGPPITAARAGSPATETPIAAPTATSTPLPTETATVTSSPTTTPAPTDTPTATPIRGDAGLRIDPQPGVFAWVRTTPDDTLGATEGLLSTTWGNPRPSVFAWPAGRPLHVQPGLDSAPAHVRLVITDTNTGAMVYLIPREILPLTYTVSGVGCGPVAATPLPYATSAAYPGAIEPRTASERTVIWAPAELPEPRGWLRCPSDTLTLPGHGGRVTLTSTFRRLAIFDMLAPTPTSTPTSTPVPPPVAVNQLVYPDQPGAPIDRPGTAYQQYVNGQPVSQDGAPGESPFVVCPPDAPPSPLITTREAHSTGYQAMGAGTCHSDPLPTSTPHTITVYVTPTPQPTATRTPIPPTLTAVPAPPWPTAYTMPAPVTSTPDPLGCVGPCPAPAPPTAWFTPAPQATPHTGALSLRVLETVVATALPGAVVAPHPHNAACPDAPEGVTTDPSCYELAISVPFVETHALTYTVLLVRDVGEEQ